MGLGFRPAGRWPSLTREKASVWGLGLLQASRHSALVVLGWVHGSHHVMKVLDVSLSIFEKFTWKKLLSV